MSLTVERAEHWKAILEELGLRVAIDPRNMNPPCVVITPPEVTFAGLGSWGLDWTFQCVVPPPGTLDAWAALDNLVAAVLTVAPLATARPRTSYTTGDGTPLPTYEVEFTEFVRNA